MGEAARRVLILGGTAEARELAQCCAGLAGLESVYSLAGRTGDPALPGTSARIGGFGGASGLAAYLETEGISALVDATHPFAATISANAAAACDLTGKPRLTLCRPPWTREPGDDWREVDDVAAAASVVAAASGRVFLALGRQRLTPFAARPDFDFVVRVAEPPPAELPLDGARVVVGRGPFAVADEIALFRREAIGVVVARNSGGAGAYAKIAAARTLGLPVILIRRPPPPRGGTVESVEQALAWIAEPR